MSSNVISSDLCFEKTAHVENGLKLAPIESKMVVVVVEEIEI